MPEPASCLFCRICSGEASATRVHEDEHAVVIRDINPGAPLHLLVLPRKHIATLNDLTPADDALVGHLHRIAAQVAKAEGHHDYRTVVNCGARVGQSVFHLHIHVLAGRALGWPPG
jgi:histidine triad (HIT) family protein